MWVQRDWPELKGPKNGLLEWSSQKLLGVWLGSWGLSAGIHSGIHEREGWHCWTQMQQSQQKPVEITLIVGILLQFLGAPFLGFPGAVLTLLKTWSISRSLESLRDPPAEPGCRRARPTSAQLGSFRTVGPQTGPGCEPAD